MPFISLLLLTGLAVFAEAAFNNGIPRGQRLSADCYSPESNPTAIGRGANGRGGPRRRFDRRSSATTSGGTVISATELANLRFLFGNCLSGLSPTATQPATQRLIDVNVNTTVASANGPPVQVSIDSAQMAVLFNYVFVAAQYFDTWPPPGMCGNVMVITPPPSTNLTTTGNNNKPPIFGTVDCNTGRWLADRNPYAWAVTTCHDTISATGLATPSPTAPAASAAVLNSGPILMSSLRFIWDSTDEPIRLGYRYVSFVVVAWVTNSTWVVAKRSPPVLLNYGALASSTSTSTLTSTSVTSTSSTSQSIDSIIASFESAAYSCLLPERKMWPTISDMAPYRFGLDIPATIGSLQAVMLLPEDRNRIAGYVAFVVWMSTSTHMIQRVGSTAGFFIPTPGAIQEARRCYLEQAGAIAGIVGLVVAANDVNGSPDDSTTPTILLTWRTPNVTYDGLEPAIFAAVFDNEGQVWRLNYVLVPLTTASSQSSTVLSFTSSPLTTSSQAFSKPTNLPPKVSTIASKPTATATTSSATLPSKTSTSNIASRPTSAATFPPKLFTTTTTSKSTIIATSSVATVPPKTSKTSTTMSATTSTQLTSIAVTSAPLPITPRGLSTAGQVTSSTASSTVSSTASPTVSSTTARKGSMTSVVQTSSANVRSSTSSRQITSASATATNTVSSSSGIAARTTTKGPSFSATTSAFVATVTNTGGIRTTPPNILQSTTIGQGGGGSSSSESGGALSYDCRRHKHDCSQGYCDIDTGQCSCITSPQYVGFDCSVLASQVYQSSSICNNGIGCGSDPDSFCVASASRNVPAQCFCGYEEYGGATCNKQRVTLSCGATGLQLTIVPYPSFAAFEGHIYLVDDSSDDLMDDKSCLFQLIDSTYTLSISYVDLVSSCGGDSLNETTSSTNNSISTYSAYMGKVVIQNHPHWLTGFDQMLSIKCTLTVIQPFEKSLLLETNGNIRLYSGLEALSELPETPIQGQHTEIEPIPVPSLTFTLERYSSNTLPRQVVPLSGGPPVKVGEPVLVVIENLNPNNSMLYKAMRPEDCSLTIDNSLELRLITAGCPSNRLAATLIRWELPSDGNNDTASQFYSYKTNPIVMVMSRIAFWLRVPSIALSSSAAPHVIEITCRVKLCLEDAANLCGISPSRCLAGTNSSVMMTPQSTSSSDQSWNGQRRRKFLRQKRADDYYEDGELIEEEQEFDGVATKKPIDKRLDELIAFTTLRYAFELADESTASKFQVGSSFNDMLKSAFSTNPPIKNRGFLSTTTPRVALTQKQSKPMTQNAPSNSDSSNIFEVEEQQQLSSTRRAQDRQTSHFQLLINNVNNWLLSGMIGIGFLFVGSLVLVIYLMIRIKRSQGYNLSS